MRISDIKAQIGNFQILHTQTLLLPADAEGVVSFQLEGWHPTFRVRFTFDPMSPRPHINVAGKVEKPTEGLIELVNWHGPIALATTSPVQVGVYVGRLGVYVMVVYHQIGAVNHLELQFCLGGL